MSNTQEIIRLMYPTTTLGTDSEFFFTNPEGQIVPADHLLPSAEDPYLPFKGRRPEIGLTSVSSELDPSKCVSLHWDGIQGEFCVFPSHCIAYVMDRVREAFRAAYSLASENNLEVSVIPSIKVTEDVVASACEGAQVFGCNPEFVTWLNGDVHPIDVNPYEHMIRYAGTHIHLGACSTSSDKFKATLLLPENQLKIVRLLDIFVGIPFVLLDQHPAVKTRRLLYGKAGTFRPTSYGLEYRALSNTVSGHPISFSLAMVLSRLCVELVHHNKYEEVMKSLSSPADVIRPINNNDYDKALPVWGKMKNFLHNLEGAMGFPQGSIDIIDSLISKNGIYTYDHGNFYDNWNLRVGALSDHGSFTTSFSEYVRSSR